MRDIAQLSINLDPFHFVCFLNMKLSYEEDPGSSFVYFLVQRVDRKNKKYAIFLYRENSWRNDSKVIQLIKDDLELPIP